jgi:hypothetical protein
VVDSACSLGGTITAKCVKGPDGAGDWSNVQGACQTTSKLHSKHCWRGTNLKQQQQHASSSSSSSSSFRLAHVCNQLKHRLCSGTAVARLLVVVALCIIVWVHTRFEWLLRNRLFHALQASMRVAAVALRLQFALDFTVRQPFLYCSGIGYG